MAKKNDKIQNESDLTGTIPTSGEFSIDEEPKSKVASVIVTILIVLIWLAIFVIVIKTDIGGFGSNIVAPVIKDVPVLNKILPEGTVLKDSTKSSYSSMADAVDYINELEAKVAKYKESDKEKNQTISDLQSENDRLKQFEQQQNDFQAQKKQYYDEVVFGDNAIDYNNYIQYYKEIEPEKAEQLYKEAIAKYAYDETYTSRAKMYSSMKPASAAKIFCEMTGDMDTVAGILNSMNTTNSGAIMDEITNIDSVFAAKLTKLLLP